MSHVPNPDYSFAGAPAARAADLKAGGQIPLLGGAAVLTVLEAVHDTASGSTLLHLDPPASGPGPVQLPSTALVNVHRLQPEAEAEQDADEDTEDEEVTVTVALTVTEEVTYAFEAELELLASAVADPEALRDYLAENEDVWLDHLDPLTHCISVDERSLDDASLVLAV
ncbi:hypothetical protein J7E93_06370 [Streptomyces sp. ISL-36]|uniref:hypothetical protein n=1 Tax=Streptomyces sp. ISL-36 TaxID=2819182 RepID=UPI001BEA5AA9|nr:hypothetical protein [Streptomyces sp. ISL-36]MBT2439751.1 hypothetical protein [Streptomyces sp. ISL-36]